VADGQAQITSRPTKKYKVIAKVAPGSAGREASGGNGQGASEGRGRATGKPGDQERAVVQDNDQQSPVAGVQCRSRSGPRSPT